MRTFYVLIIALVMAATTQLQAQTQLTQAVDFTVTDVHGVQHNLFSILNGGQYVCIDFFFTTCPPCITTSPMYAQTYQDFGCNQEDIFFIAIDVGDTDQEVIAYENSVFGGTPGYPSVSGVDDGGNAVVTTYGIGAYPTYILIAPNQQIVEQDMWPISSAATFATYFAGHGLTPKNCTTVGLFNPDSEQEGITVYPNPAKDLLQVQVPEDANELRIYDAIGQLVYSERLTGVNNGVDISAFNEGVYIVEVFTDTRSFASKFIKN